MSQPRLRKTPSPAERPPTERELQRREDMRLLDEMIRFATAQAKAHLAAQGQSVEDDDDEDDDPF